MTQVYFLILLGYTIFSQCITKHDEHMLYNREEIQKICNKKASLDVLDVLGYDPQVRFVPDTRSTLKHKRLSIFVHGFGGSGNCVQFIQKFNPSDYVTFHLPDYTLPGKTSAFSQTSFGGENEILPCIYVLNMLRQQGILAFDIVALSRGGAVIINTLAALLDPSSTLDTSLHALGIGTHERASILQIIQNGTITLWHPLWDLQSLIEEKVKNSIQTGRTSKATKKKPSKFASWWNSLGSASVARSVTRSIQYVVLPALTAYKPWASSVSTSLKILEKHSDFTSKMLIILQPKDAAVGNSNEGSYIEALPVQKEHTYIVVGTTPGHLHLDTHQLVAINTFRRKYGASYDDTSNLLNDILLGKSKRDELIKTYGSTQNFLDEYYKKAQTDQSLYWNGSN